MIGFLRGEIIEKGENYLLVDVNGVGFLVRVPAGLLDRPIGSIVAIYTHQYVRENEIALYGFSDKESLEFFRTLLGISGIGPKIALSILSSLPLEALRETIDSGKPDLLTMVPGIGAKKARQIIFALKDVIIFADHVYAAIGTNDTDSEVLAALTGLGYSLPEAREALRLLPTGAKDELIEERVRLALMSLAKI